MGGEGAGGKSSYNAGSFPVEVSDTMKVSRPSSVCVYTTTPHTDTLSGCLVAAGRIQRAVCPSIKYTY